MKLWGLVPTAVVNAPLWAQISGKDFGSKGRDPAAAWDVSDGRVFIDCES